MPYRNTECARTSPEQHRADLDETTAALPGWCVWATWDFGYRTWHAVPDFPGSDGLAGPHLAQTAPDRVTAPTREALITACRERQP